MAKYIMVYKRKEALDQSTLPKEQVAKMMDAWGEWTGRMGAAVVNKGERFSSGKSLTKAGLHEADNLLGGFTIIEAKDFDEALGYAKGCPILEQGGSVEIYEAFAV